MMNEDIRVKVFDKKKILKNYLINSGAILAVLIILSLLGRENPSDLRNLIILASINILAAVSLNMMCGSLGELVLGHAGFMLTGAYAAGIFTKAWQVSDKLMVRFVMQPAGYLQIILAVLIAGLVAALLAFIISIPFLRLKGDYLAIVTLGFTLIMVTVAVNMPMSPESGWYTSGAQGLIGVQNILEINAFMAVAIMILSVTIILLFMLSRHGRAILAIREDYIAAEASGIKVNKYKVITFVISAFFAGVAGGVYAFYNNVAPTKFSFEKSIEILVMVVLGGIGSYTGSILSAFALTALPILLLDFSRYQKLVYAIILLVVMLIKPTGLFGTKEFTWKALKEAPKKFYAWLKALPKNISNGFKNLGQKIKYIFKKPSNEVVESGGNKDERK
ncbi:MAG: branched-chain amino acid ABC transporter permease [Bacilli bacterium]|jgi:branched-chain amino acid transport system permease protein